MGRAKLQLLAVVLAAVAVSSGCLLKRITTVHGQLCAYDENFELDVDRGVAVTMKRPVLLDKDVRWLAGTDPSETEVDGDVLRMRYVIEQNVEAPNAEHDVDFRLEFVEVGDRYRLRQGWTDLDLADRIGESLVTNVMEQACGARPNLLKRSASFDLDGLDPDVLPARAELVDLFGEPNALLAGGTALVYEHRIKNAGPQAPVARTEVLYDPAGERMLRVKSRFLRYELDADFVTGRAVVKLHL